MKIVLILTLFIGLFFVVHGVYEQKLKAAESNKKVEVKYVPRSYYDEQIAGAEVMSMYASIFDKASPWLDREKVTP